MITNILKEDEIKELEANGYNFQEKNNMLTIRDAAKNVVIEIINIDEDEVLINTRENYYWGTKINTIVSAHGEAIYVYYTNNDGEEDFIVGN